MFSWTHFASIYETYMFLSISSKMEVFYLSFCSCSVLYIHLCYSAYYTASVVCSILALHISTSSISLHNQEIKAHQPLFWKSQPDAAAVPPVSFTLQQAAPSLLANWVKPTFTLNFWPLWPQLCVSMRSHEEGNISWVHTLSCPDLLIILSFYFSPQLPGGNSTGEVGHS